MATRPMDVTQDTTGSPSDRPQEKTPARYPGIRSTADGSGAVVWVESQICQGACAYPITPSTPMGDGFAVEYSNGRRNLWDEPIRFLEPESEHSSASACEGFALAGGRVTNFTSGQGLILMKEVLYVIAGKRLPIVFHIGARALTSHSLNVHCGHDDVMGVADVGWGMLFARNAQECADLAVMARWIAEETETPFFVVQDGFLTTHTLETVQLPEPELMREFVGSPAERMRKLFDPTQPLMSGVVQNQDSYMKGKVAQRHFYEGVPEAMRTAMRRYTELTGREYSPLRTYRMEGAEFALIGMGSMMETAEATVDVPLAESNPLTTEVKAALADGLAGADGHRLEWIPEIFSGVAGLGGRDLRPGHLIAAVENMMAARPKKFFVLGVKHRDALAAAEKEPDVRPAGAFSLRGHSVGGFGSVTTNKILATVASEVFGLYAQAFPKYGSEKKGLPTNYYLTLAPEPVRLHAELNTVEFVAVQDANALAGGDVLAGLARGGTIYLQSPLPASQLWTSLPAAVQQRIRDNGYKLFVLDATRIARESATRPELQVRMQGIALLGAFLRLTPFQERAGITTEKLFDSLGYALEKYFGKRGKQVVADNLAAARRGYDEVAEVAVAAAAALPVMGNGHHPAKGFQPCGNGVLQSDFCERVIGSYSRGRDFELEADEYVARSLMPPSSAKHRSFRNLAPLLPQLHAEACVGCMECVNECPDTAILAKVVTPETLDEHLLNHAPENLRATLRTDFSVTNKYHDVPAKKGQTGGLFGIFIDPDKCKGCGECVTACGSHNALTMIEKTGADLARYDASMALYEALPETPAQFLNEKSLGDMMLASRSLLFAGGAGSCMGCGEATAVRMLLAATGFQYGAENIGIVAATGCNTVFGSTYPFNPYGVPWTNSLFENAPADAMGIRLRWEQEGHQKRRLWVFGGDGAMYDIGFQSLSRMLMSGMDIKVLVLDTQVYSNTGGQTSTATFTSQDAKMAAFGKSQPGKREHRKELAQIAMMHPGVFVAQTTAAHINHFYKAVQAANEYPGPAVVICYTTCQPEHGVGDDRSPAQARLAVESRTFPLMIFDPRRGSRIKECLSLQGNPAMKEDWYTDPKTSAPVDFVAFARTEGRFARHFNEAGEPDEYLSRACEDRLENWRRLQELAGLR